MTTEKTTPIIICGNQRSGTRMTANTINMHPRIAIADEFHERNFLKAFELIQAIEKTYNRRPYNREPFGPRGTEIMKSIWIHSSGKARRKALQASLIGNKTPGAEMYFRKYEWIFAESPPRYFYCLRSAFAVLRSVKNLPNLPWHGRSIEENLRSYLLSVEKYKTMKREFSDRVFLVQVREMGQTLDSKRAFTKRLMDFLGEDVDDIPPEAFENLRPSNTMEQIKKRNGQAEACRVELTSEETAAIASNREYQAVAEEFGLET